MSPPAVALTFDVRDAGAGLEVVLSSPGYEPVSAPFDFDSTRNQLQTIRRYLADNRAGPEHIKLYGGVLCGALMAGEVGRRFLEIRAESQDPDPFYHIRLRIPEDLRSIPWETLYDERLRVLLAEDERFCIVHDPPRDLELADPPAPAEDGPLRVLVVVPEGAGVDAGREYARLDALVGRVGADRVTLERLGGRVTPERLREALGSRWDVLHFIGHGDTRAGQAALRFNRADGTDRWVEADVFGLIFRGRPVRLAVLNSCLGESPGGHTMAGAAPPLLAAGVPAVVAMRFEIYEKDALRFTPAFYRHLLQVSGRVDRALEHARFHLRLNPHDDSHRGFVTPVLWLREGHEQLLKPVAAESAPEPRGAAQPPPELDLDPALVAALEGGRAVPVLGPGLLRAGLVRRDGKEAEPPPGPRELADLLGRSFEYPIPRDFELSDSAPWTAESLLQRVCQHCDFVHEGVFQVLEVIERQYREAVPPRLFRELARWEVPGMVYTFFDGLLARSIHEANRAFTVMNGVVGAEEPGERRPVLVNLRGSVADRTSLVLTERDNEELAERMASLGPAVSGLTVDEPGRSVVCVGVNHRDPLVRRFLRALLGDERTRRMQGPTFIVSASHTAVDEAYWAPYRIRWVDVSPVDFVEVATRWAVGTPG